MEIFDCNLSFGCAARPPLRYAADVPALLEEMDYCGVQRALVYHTNMRFASPVTWNSQLSRDIQGQSRLKGTWAILPPSTHEQPQPQELLAAMRAAGVKALRAFPQEHRFRLDGTSFGPLWELMAQCRVPLLAKENLTQLKELLDEAPAGLIVVACNQGPHSLERFLRPLLDRHANLYLETSGLLVDGLIEEFCQRYGSGRLLFGSGYPDNAAGGALLRLMQADIEVADRVAVAGGNLTRLVEESAP